MLSPKDGTFSLRAGPIFANVVLADEINRAPAKTQSALLEAMQERQVTIEGDRFELPLPFLVLATQNPIDLEGTYPLPEAQIDRFLVRVRDGLPLASATRSRCSARTTSPAPSPRGVLSASDVLRSRRSPHASTSTTISTTTPSRSRRSRARIRRSCSARAPRATLGLVQAGEGPRRARRPPYVTPDDVRAVADSVLAHRLVLVPDVEGDAAARAAIVEEALAKVGYRRGFRPV